MVGDGRVEAAADVGSVLGESGLVGWGAGASRFVDGTFRRWRWWCGRGLLLGVELVLVLALARCMCLRVAGRRRTKAWWSGEFFM